jgi:dUTP pyrophosphatase
MKLKFYKIRKEAKLPVRAYSVDAGMDVFYCPKEGDEPFSIPNGTSRVVPTGLKVKVPECFMLEVKNKSGIAAKRQLLVGACVIDPGYDGEIFVNLHNIGKSTQIIMPGEKVAQMVLTPVIHCGIEEVFEDNLNKLSKRGKGGFGSTGKW